MVAALSDHVPGEPAAARELIGVFVEQAEQRLEALAGALERGDATEVETQAHSLKSSWALLGLADAAQTCQTLEEQARQGDLTNAARLTDEIAIQLARVARAIAQPDP